MMLFAAIDWQQFFFVLFALVTVVFAAAVLFSNNVVHMAFYLVISLGASSGLFFLAGAEFVGAMQLMIYVGGTLVLLIFGVMLTAQRRFITMKTTAGDWIVATGVGGSLLVLLLYTAFNVESWRTPHPDPTSIAGFESRTTTQIGLGLTSIRVDRFDEPDPVLRHGMSGYLFPFVIVSVHLLVVLVGAAYMARTKKRASGTQSRSPTLRRAP